jgi:virginiamycin B lyase
LIAGPDGALWFTGGKQAASSAGSTPSYTQVIGKITLDGHITEYPIPSQDKDSGVSSMCVGPDQAIWYTWTSNFNDLSNLKGRIGRMSLAGQAQEFSVPYPPERIISGPDGALWYSERDPGAPNAVGTAAWRKGFVGRITTAGVASEIPIEPNTSVSQIVAGSDGAVWYTVQEGDTGTFGRVTPGGGVKTFATPGGAQINWLVAAPSVLWIVDATNTLWRYRLPG